MGVLGFAREDEFDPLIWSAASRYGLDPLLIKATIAKESGFNPDAYRYEAGVGDASTGLMQTLLATARSLGYPGDGPGLRDPATSIEYGTAYLARQWARYGGDPGATYAAYNAGTARTDAAGFFVNSRGSREVQARVDIFLSYYRQYQQAYGALTATAGMAPEPGVPPAGGGVVVPDILRDLFGSGGQPAEAPTPPAAGDVLSEWWASITGPAPEPPLTATTTPYTAPEPLPGDAGAVDLLLADLGFPPQAAGPAREAGSWVPLLIGAALVGLLVLWD